MTIQQAFKEACQVIDQDREKKMKKTEQVTEILAVAAPPILTREQWLAKRRECIGASEAAAVCEMGKHEDGTPVAWMPTALEVYLDKTNQLPQQEMNIAMKMGIALEPMLADLYTEQTGRKLIIPEPMQRCKDIPWIGANLDRITEDGKLNCQLKTTHDRTDDWGAPGTDEIPTYYICQVIQEMLVSGIRTTDLAVLFLRTKEFAVYTVQYNEEMARTMVEIETEFWQENVLKRIPPEPDFSHPSTPRLIKAMYPGISDGKILEVPPEQLPEIVKTIELMQAAKTTRTTAENEVEQHKAFLLSMMEDAAQMKCGNRWTLTRKGIAKPEYTVKASSYVMLQVKDNDKPKAVRAKKNA